jgi:signal transduction histidine kinase
MADSKSVLRKLASLSVPFFADWCAVDVVTENGEVQRLAAVHGEPSRARVLQELGQTAAGHAPDAHGAARVVRSGEPELIEDVPAVLERVMPDADRRRLLAEVGVASSICVPVKVHGIVAATLTFATSDAERRYGTRELRVAEDLAYRVAIAIENAELYHAALEADRRKDEFLATLSHELRTPLNAIVGWTHILRESQADPELVRRAADTIHRNAQLQTQLIADLLDVSRIVAGKRRPGPCAWRRCWTRRPAPSPATPSGCSRWCGTCSPTPSSSCPRSAAACTCAWRR